MALDLPSVLGGLAQGFLDFGKSTVDLLGTGTASVADLVQSGGKSTKNQDDFRKWLYKTDSAEDAAAKGLGTALNGAQTIVDFIPPVSAITKTPLGNGLQGAVGGLADEFKEYGKDYDLARAGERAAISGGAAIASGGLSDALKGSANSLLSSGAIRGLASGGIAGGVTGGGYAAIDGGDILEGAKQGASMGALVGGATGLGQDFRPAKAPDVVEASAETPKDLGGTLSASENSINNAKSTLATDDIAKRARNNYADNRQAQFELLQKTNPMRDDYHTGIRSPEEIYTLKNIVDSYNEDNNFTYPDFTLADAQKAIANGSIDVYGSKPIEPGAFATPSKMMATDYAGGGEIYTKNIPLEDFAFIESGDEGNYLPLSKNKTLDATLSASENAINDKYSDLIKKAKNYKSLNRFEKMNNPIKGSEIWGEKPKSYFERDSRAVRINMFPNDATKGTGITKQYLLNMFKDAYDDGITDIVPSYGSYTKEGASFMDHLADQGWVKQNGNGGWKSYEIAPKIAEWKKTTPLADIYNEAHGLNKTLETTLSDADMAVNNPRYLTDENGNPRTFYHGSPNKNITEFDINQAGKNTSSGEHALYFTDSPEVADEFSYERLPSDSMFVDNRGAKGRVYPVNLEMNNPLDLDNLTDAQIRELWQYASPLGQLDGQEKFIKNLTEFRDVAHNGQLTKTLLDLDKLKNSPYDGFTARMYPNQDNQAREYAVFDNSKVKMLEDVLANDDMAVNSPKLTPEQEAFFKDSVIRDENGNLMPMYHGSNSKFTVFDSSKGGQSNKTAKVGHWFTPNEEGAKNFANSVWYGDESEPTVYSTYLNVKNPKVYEAVDNTAQIKALNNEIDSLQRQLDGMRRGSDDFNATYKKYNDLAKQIENLSYGDPYEQFRSDIYAMEGKTPYQANVGGLGMMMDDENAATQKYVQSLRDQGYDGIIIRGTNYDNGTLGGVNDQYVVFDSNQIKDINNLRPTADADIMYSKVAEGQLGLFDQPIAETEAVDAVNTKNPYAPVDGKVTKAMKDRYNELMASADGFSQITDNELYNKIDKSTLPKGYDKLQQLLDNQMGENNRVAAELKKGIGTDMPLQADLEKLADYVYGDEINGKNTFLKDLDDSIRLNRKNAEFVGIDSEQAEADARSHAKQKLVSKAMEKAERKVIDDIVGTGDSDDILYALQNYRRRGIRTGRAGALDTALSERLGIAPGNTVKVTDATSDDHLRSGTLGRYARNKRDIALSDINSPEGKISTMAHERLHSFQNEARPESAGRYSPEVAEAYKELQKDLGHHYKSHAEIRKHWKKSVDYYADSGEQESRMFQQYLENKGYTDNSAYRGLMNQSGEWGNEINPAFDKFINKLRDLSKRGVALPALATLFGGGAYMANQGQEKDKDKEEVL